MAEHGEWLAPLALFLVISIRIIAVAQGDVSIAQGLVAAAGPLDIALQALLDSMWIVFLIVAFIAWTKAIQPRWSQSPHRLIYMAVYLSIATLATLLAPLAVAIAIDMFLLAHVAVSLVTYYRSDPPELARFAASSLLDRVDFRRQHARFVDQLDAQRAELLRAADQLSVLKDAVAAAAAEGQAQDPEWAAEIARLGGEVEAHGVTIEQALRNAKSVDAWTPTIQGFSLIAQWSYCCSFFKAKLLGFLLNDSNSKARYL